MTAASEILQTRWTDAVFVGDLDLGSDVWDSRRIEQAVHLAGAAIKHEDLTEVGAGGAQQVEPVGLGFGKRLLVTENDARRIVLDPAERDKATPLGRDFAS